MTISDLKAQLIALGNTDIAKKSLRYFKTAPGQYGHGDLFLGIRAPVLRKEARTHRGISQEWVSDFLASQYHELRLFALMVLVEQFNRGDETKKKSIYSFYLSKTEFINNWDLVDTSAYYIVGAHLLTKDRDMLYTLAQSQSLWERRIAMVACLSFIRKGDYKDTLALAEVLLNDPEDLINKAVGWMLKEMGKRDRLALEGF